MNKVPSMCLYNLGSLFFGEKLGRLVAGVLLALVVFPGDGAVFAQEPLDKTRAWVVTELRASLKQSPDMNRVISMLYAVAMDYIESRNPDSDKVMAEVAAHLQELDINTLSCGQLVDLKMAVSTLGKAGRSVSIEGLGTRFAACDFDSSPFELACALFYYCHFTPENPEEHLPGGMAALTAMQRPDGGFGPFRGLPEFYFSSHAVFAVHACKGGSDVVDRGQQYLLSILPQFRDAEFMDGVLESLLMLDKMGVTVPGRRGYTEFVGERVRPDGSVCYFNHPGCDPDWHASSLLLEFLRSSAEARVF